ncbi:Alkylated DNA nucleotide flippase Atl1, participates in nucleotide excision repair, Ada-like DNA-binding domain [Sinosporangium album]|uniref:Alkylated DNA nucleotide flippase Atl1, participates in nucleotide excision repair, Ada-like DNA-binding domain n=2 Tax=Sinosporangium album TaxID=504805 RepID=A0A1G7SZA2_9ACTN|nr:Alkylated DNA nucleotide flippase Atl1, participates in nucleotide excision repair, Ada-like DNA-binding domain [Sinosporangium album]
MNEFADHVERYTLVPTQLDRDSWIKLVERDPAAGGEDGIGNAYRFFKGQLEELIDDDSNSRDWYQSIEKVAVGKLSFVEISAQPGDNVYRIFESLNNTGLKLTQADLLRNYLFMRLPIAGERIYGRYWLPMQKLFDEQQLVDLIWLDLVIKRGGRPTNQHSIYRDQQRHLSGLESESEIEEWVSELYRMALVFRRILHPDEENNTTIGKALDRLHRWKAKVVYPVALKVMLAYEDRLVDPDGVADILRVVESYMVRQMLIGMGRAGNNVMLIDLVRSLDDEVPSAQSVTRTLTHQRGRFPTDEMVREAILEHPFYWRGKPYQKEFVLRCLEEGIGRNEKIDFDSSNLSIEHILPQSLTPDWKTDLEHDINPEGTVEELHETIVHTLGNLTLSAYNGSLSNKPFAAKKHILAGSGLAMNLRIAKEDRWGAAEIKKRGEELADLAITIWPGPDDTVKVDPVSPKLALARKVLSEIPSGRWTNYLVIAQVAGIHRRTVSKWIEELSLPNSHRVLKSDGSIPAKLPTGVTDSGEQLQILRSEGVIFGGNGRASKKCHIGMVDLLKIIEGVEGDDSPPSQGELDFA